MQPTDPDPLQHKIAQVERRIGLPLSEGQRAYLLTGEVPEAPFTGEYASEQEEREAHQARLKELKEVFEQASNIPFRGEDAPSLEFTGSMLLARARLLLSNASDAASAIERAQKLIQSQNNTMVASMLVARESQLLLLVQDNLKVPELLQGVAQRNAQGHQLTVEERASLAADVRTRFTRLASDVCTTRVTDVPPSPPKRYNAR